MPEKKVKVLQSKRPFSSYDNLVSNVLMVRVDTAHLLACLQYDDVPEIQTVLLEEVEPLDETDFVVAAARHGALGMAVDNLARRGGESVKGRSPLDGDLTKTERGIAQDCRKTMMAVNLLLEEEGT
jgi:hypothetical protein